MILFFSACARKASKGKRPADAVLYKAGEPVGEIRPDKVTFPAAGEEKIPKKHIEDLDFVV